MTLHYCSSCKGTKDGKDFKPKGNQPGKTCLTCSKRKQSGNKENSTHPPNTRRETAGPHTAHNVSEEGGEDPEEDDFFGLTVLALPQYLNAIEAAEDVGTFAACVNIAEWKGLDSREKGNKLAQVTWERLRYRFMCILFTPP